MAWWHHPAAPPRSDDDRVIGGVCAGLAQALDVDAALVRVAAVVLAATGPGVPLYLLAWLLMPAGGSAGDEPATDGVGAARRTAGLGLIVVGAILTVRQIGLAPPDEFVWPVIVIAVGVGVVLWQVGPGPVAGAPGALRIAAGIVVVGLGLIAFVAGNFSFSVVRDGLLALAFVVGGLALILGPWITVLVRQRSEERRRRIRADERAEVAAHLHDSVLQTFALIQRSDDARQMTALARQQERELRRWLYDSGSDPGAATVKAAFERVAAEVEDRHGVTIEAVVVGDAPLTTATEALVAAAAEAMANAAKWSGENRMSAYLEVGPDQIEAFVRDTGAGFDRADLGEDRMGIRESIEGRMRRAGGQAQVTSAPGDGTEVRLLLPAG